MTREIFDQQIGRLRVRWKNAFDPEFVSLLANRIGDAPNDAFVEVVNSIIGSRPVSKPPLIEDFTTPLKAYARSGRKRYALGEPQPNASCRDCQDSGFIRLVRKPEFESWARFHTGSAPCHCGRGKLVSQSAKHDFGPQFNDRWLKSYDILESPRAKSE